MPSGLKRKDGEYVVNDFSQTAGRSRLGPLSLRNPILCPAGGLHNEHYHDK